MRTRRMTDAELFGELVRIANEQSDGHFTVMKFTTNWRVAFETPNDRFEIEAMCEGKTFLEAAEKAISCPREAAGDAFYDRAKKLEQEFDDRMQVECEADYDRWLSEHQA